MIQNINVLQQNLNCIKTQLSQNVVHKLKKNRRFQMKLTLTVILFCILNLAFGQSEKEYPIDIELQNCLDSNVNYTTKGMTDCVVQATEKWDEKLNENYQKLLTTDS